MAWTPTFAKSLRATLRCGVRNAQDWLNCSPSAQLANKHVVAATLGVVGSAALGAEAFARAGLNPRCGKTLEDRVATVDQRAQNNKQNIGMLKLQVETLKTLPHATEEEPLRTLVDIEKRVEHLEGAVEMFTECVRLMNAELETLHAQQIAVTRQQHLVNQQLACARK